jgi:hypothetical protein
LIRETTENESANAGYRFGQEEETYNIVAAHGYFGPQVRRSSPHQEPKLPPTTLCSRRLQETSELEEISNQ